MRIGTTTLTFIMNDYIHTISKISSLIWCGRVVLYYITFNTMIYMPYIISRFMLVHATNHCIIINCTERESGLRYNRQVQTASIKWWFKCVVVMVTKPVGYLWKFCFILNAIAFVPVPVYLSLTSLLSASVSHFIPVSVWLLEKHQKQLTSFHPPHLLHRPSLSTSPPAVPSSMLPGWTVSRPWWHKMQWGWRICATGGLLVCLPPTFLKKTACLIVYPACSEMLW